MRKATLMHLTTTSLTYIETVNFYIDLYIRITKLIRKLLHNVILHFSTLMIRKLHSKNGTFT